MVLYAFTMIFYVMIFQIFNFVFVDESGIQKYHCRIKCRAKRGVKVYATKPGRKFKKTNVVAGLLYGNSGKKHVGVHCYAHSTNADFFEDWFEWQLLSEVPENSMIIMDNASFRRKHNLIEIAARYGVVVIFLPPYSPEFNPIEHSWANLKEWLNYNLCRFFSLDFAIDSFFESFRY